MAKRLISRLIVRTRPGNRQQGWLHAGTLRIPVALGRGGIKPNKREGDGATPAGRFRLVRLWWRPDRLRRPITMLPVRAIHPDDGWCEDPKDRRYNRPVKLRSRDPADRLTRADHLYDLVIELDHNARPRISGRGSAVFVHVARPGLTPTAGCVALPYPRLRKLLGHLSRNTRINIH